ncbi:MAG TPA: peptide chain release factor N(5)-glutamine methyltransferase [Methylomirabilota bacterium]|jgi:release factor glutamine methyltransferase
MTGAATAREHVAAATATLRAAGVESAASDAEWLLADVLGVPRLRIHVAADTSLSDVQRAQYAAAVRRRAAREPLQHILGWEDFRGLRLRVTPAVLIPRPETELLAGWALELLPPPAVGARPIAVDVGTGSGCIACAIAAERPDVGVVAVDLSPKAAEVARANADRLGLGRRVAVVSGDLLSALRPGRADLVVANVPYLATSALGDLAPEVRAADPRLALDGGADGLRVLRGLVAAAAPFLRSGALVLETGGPDQVEAVVQLLEVHGFHDVARRDDLAGVTRFVAGRRD